jgi:multicomponent Na+:H+ antiporter subunit E
MNILLTLAWVALYGDFTPANFILGFTLSFGVMWVISRGSQDQRYFTRVPRIISFLVFFIYELIKANLQVAWEVITPTHHMTPGIIKVPLDAESDLEITLLANVITLTPGTLSLSVSADRKHLFVHSMYIKSREEFIAGIKGGFEKRLLAITR